MGMIPSHMEIIMSIDFKLMSFTSFVRIFKAKRIQKNTAMKCSTFINDTLTLIDRLEIIFSPDSQYRQENYFKTVSKTKACRCEKGLRAVIEGEIAPSLAFAFYEIKQELGFEDDGFIHEFTAKWHLPIETIHDALRGLTNPADSSLNQWAHALRNTMGMTQLINQNRMIAG